jgi:hypothetical protein
MVGITAGRIIALVADQKAFRNRAICEFPCNSMGNPHSSWIRKFYSSITWLASMCLPFPTLIPRANCDFIPESKHGNFVLERQV